MSSPSPIAYGSYYGLQNTSDSLFLSWQGVGVAPKAYSAIVYKDQKALWFDSATGGTGTILTGDKVYIKISVVVHLYLGAAPPGFIAEWADSGGTGSIYTWQVYTDSNLTVGNTITLGQNLYIVNTAYSNATNYLTPSSQSPFVTIGSTPATWSIHNG
jgi:hypothetical protein